MVVTFDKLTQSRLAAIEADEGIPADEFVRQAADVWLLADQRIRRAIVLAVMSAALNKIGK